MATYLGTHGSKIQNYTTDPDNPNTGEVWYNTTANTLKFQIPNTTTSGSWSTGGNLNTGRVNSGAAGVQTSGLIFGGKTPPNTAITEAYNGTSWTEVNDLNTSRESLGGAGANNTAALAFGGNNPSNTAATELWGGTNWTNVNSLNNARQLLVGGGTSTSALAFSGWNPYRAETESWNGSNWTEVADLNTARYYAAGCNVSMKAVWCVAIVLI